MLRITLTMMRKSARVLVASALAIIVGSMFICGTFLFANGLDDALMRRLAARYAQANYALQLDNRVYEGNKPARVDSNNKPQNPDEYVDEGVRYVQRRFVDYHFSQLRNIQGVQGYSLSTTRDAFIKSAAHSVNTRVLVATPGHPELLPLKIVEGRQPTGKAEIMLPQEVRKIINVRVGETITIERIDYGNDEYEKTKPIASSMSVRVVGFVEDTFNLFNGASVVSDDVMAMILRVNRLEQAQADTIFMRVDPDQADQTLARIHKLLPYVKHERIADAINTMFAQMSGSNTKIVTICLLSFGVLSMFVAAMVIANTFQVLVAQRRHMLALLRTLGAYSSQLYRSVLCESTVLGLVASIIGVLGGIGMMLLVYHLPFMMSLNIRPRLIITPISVIVPIVFSLMVTVLASLVAARSATKVKPLEALRPLDLVETRVTSVKRVIVSVLLALIGVFLVTRGISGVNQLAQKFTEGAGAADSGKYGYLLLGAVVGCGLIFIAVLISAVLWMPHVMRALSSLVSLVGPSARVSAANIRRNPRRIAATGTALLIGVTLVVTVATGASIGKTTLAQLLDERYSVDLVMRGPSVNQSAARQVAAIKGVRNVMLVSETDMQVTEGENTYTVNLLGIPSTQALQKVIRTHFSLTHLAPKTVIVPQKYHGHVQLRLHDNKITMNVVPEDDATPSGQTYTFPAQQLMYGSVIAEYSITAFTSQNTVRMLNLPVKRHALLVNVDLQKTSIAEMQHYIRSIASKLGNTEVSGPIVQRADWESKINALFIVLLALLGVAVLIALIGVANTLSLSIIERTHESAILRAIGMTRGQLRRSLACEAITMAVGSTIAGIILGSFFGYIGSYMVYTFIGDVPWVFDWTIYAVVLIIAVIAALISSVLPARRAAKASPVAALGEE